MGILSRSFQDLCVGMAKFHEALHLSHSPVPLALPSVTEFLLLAHGAISPFQLAVWTKGAPSAAFCTFGLVVVLRLINGLASEIEHPFGGDCNDIDTRRLHYDLNVRLLELLKFSKVKGARTSKGAKQGDTPRLVKQISTSSTYSKDASKTNGGRLDDLLGELIAASALIEDTLARETSPCDSASKKGPADE